MSRLQRGLNSLGGNATTHGASRAGSMRFSQAVEGHEGPWTFYLARMPVDYGPLVWLVLGQTVSGLAVLRSMVCGSGGRGPGSGAQGQGLRVRGSSLPASGLPGRHNGLAVHS